MEYVFEYSDFTGELRSGQRIVWGFDDHATEMARVQALRAEPTGQAASDEARRRTFGAALQQFDELLSAALTIGPASSPLPLFYALTQAGRAIAAAWMPDDRWDFHGHGLKVSAERERLGRSIIKPEPRRRKVDGLYGDGFSVVAEATASGALTAPVEMGAVWASIPHLEIVEDLGEGFPAALHLESESYASPIALSARVRVPEAALPDPEAWSRIDERLRAYPDAAGYEIRGRVEVGELDGNRHAVSLQWPTSDRRAMRAVQTVGQSYLSKSDVYLRPGLGTNLDVLSPLMSWWLLLIALSQIARYEPAAWTHALNPDQSKMAIPISNGLRTAARVLPRVVLDALISRPRAL